MADVSDDEHRDLADEALLALRRLTDDGRQFVLGCLTWDAPEAVLHAIDMAADEDQGYVQ